MRRYVQQNPTTFFHCLERVGVNKCRIQLPYLEWSCSDIGSSGIVKEEYSRCPIESLCWIYPRCNACSSSLSKALHNRMIHLKWERSHIRIIWSNNKSSQTIQPSTINQFGVILKGSTKFTKCMKMRFQEWAKDLFLAIREGTKHILSVANVNPQNISIHRNQIIGLPVFSQRTSHPRAQVLHSHILF